MREPIIQEDRIKPIRTPQARRQRRVAITVLLAVLAIATGGYFLLAPRQQIYRLKEFETAVVQMGSLAQTTQASGTVSVPATLRVLSPETGYAAQLAVQEGERVSKGQLLARLEVPDLVEELEDLRADIEVKEQNLKSSLEQDRFTSRKLEQGLRYLGEDIARAEKEIVRVNQLVAIHASRQSELEEAEQALAALLRSKEQQELSIEECRVLSALSQENQQSTIARLQLDRQRLEQRIRGAGITSPMSGEVLEIESSLAVPRSLISQNQALFSIADRSSALVELEVAETYASHLKPGDQVRLTVGGRQLGGRITAVARLAQASSDGIGSTVTVKVRPDGDGETLLPGASVVGELTVGTLQDVLYLPRGPYLTTGGQRFLYLVQGHQAVKREVTFGAVLGSHIVVLRGVAAGDTIIASGYQNFIEHQTIKLEDK